MPSGCFSGAARLPQGRASPPVKMREGRARGPALRCARVLDPAQKPMLAKLVRELAEGDVVDEPKWEGFRCLTFRNAGDVDLRSRHGRPL